MPQNKNALLRYRTIDRCLRNTGRRWTLQDLVDACSDALYEYEGKQDLVSVRSVQRDIEMMRSDKLGYEAPIEVYDRKYYRYADPEYSISNRQLSQEDINVLNRTIDLLRDFDEFDPMHEMADVVNRLQDKIAAASQRRRIVSFERNPDLKGIQFLNPLYDIIASRTTVNINYRSFNARQASEFILFPYLLKEFNNRWFLFGSRAGDMKLFNLALDRIEDFHPCADIPFKDNPDFGDDYFDDVVGVTKHDRLEKATVRFIANNQHASYILTKPIHSSQKLISKNKEDGSMTFELVDILLNTELYKAFLSFGDGIQILAPKSAVRHLRKIFHEALKKYDPAAIADQDKNNGR
ncbi:MAG: WYL domain-containing protein [Muribaculaceae bacterium]|nr:WYL domain-containing protein [Muribaculaceae bacterium]